MALGSSTVIALAVLVGALTAAAARPIETAIQISAVNGDEMLVARRIRAAGATKIRVIANWSSIAPAERPATFDPADPADPAYTWDALDELVRAAQAQRLVPFLTVVDAPQWVQEGKTKPGLGDLRPRPAELADFATAIARRYSGSFQGLPRVRYWQVWNEPNITVYLRPQFQRGQPFSPAWYRDMVNAFARSVHAVRPGNRVIAGGLSPFTIHVGEVGSMAPLRFMRALLCMSAGPRPHPTCSEKVDFDIWAHHPYTSGDATHTAEAKDDVSLGDMGEMKALLDTAVKAGQVRHVGSMELWVTEFSWDSSPPDPKAVPTRLHARWVAEAVYRMWEVGVRVFTWHQLRDDRLAVSPFQSGLYFRGKTLAADRPKPALQAFRFPFVAYREANGVTIWGRTPAGTPGRVAIERKPAGAAWRRVASVASNRFGIFSLDLPLRTGAKDYFRARTSAGASVPFSLTRPPDRPVRPFG
jgi:hypothetical protein